MVGQKTTLSRARKRWHRVVFALSAFLVVLSTIVSTSQFFFSLTDTYASSALASTFDPTQAAESYAYVNMLSWCVANSHRYTANVNWNGADYIHVSNAKNYIWWLQNDDQTGWLQGLSRLAYGSSYLNSDVDNNGQATCNDVLQAAVKIWSNNNSNWPYKNGAELLCDITDNKLANGSACKQGNGTYTFDSNFGNPAANNGVGRFWQIVKKDVYGGKDPYMSFSTDTHTNGAALYTLYNAAFMSPNGCGAQQFINPPKNNYSYDNITTVKPDGTSTQTKDYQTKAQDSTTITVYTYDQNGDEDKETCSQIAANVTKYSGDYVAWEIKHPAQAQTKGKPGLCATDPTDPSCTASSSNKSSCVIGGVGWFVCTVAVFLANAADAMYKLISNFFAVPPVDVSTNGSNGLYNTWVIMRNLANVGFIIGFLIIIFSQLTDMGISNYGVKKTLPRLVVAAILVNLSYWIAAVAVDISNVLGVGFNNLFQGIISQMNIGNISNNWVNVITGLIGGGTLALGTGATITAAAVGTAIVAPTALMYMAIPAVLAALLAILTVVFILVARQALIIILIIISPLAFVSMLLPNTEKWFTKWRQALTALLLMYPIMSVVFGGSQIAGLAIISSAEQGSSVQTGALILTGMLTEVIPFFFIPFLLTKFSGGNIDKMVGSVRKRANMLMAKPIGMANKARNDAFGRGWGRAKYGTYEPRLDKNGNETGFSRMRRGILGGKGNSGIGSVGRSYDQWQWRKKSESGTYAHQQEEEALARLGTDSTFATMAAGGSTTGGQRLADRAQAAAEAEELKKALQPLIRTLAGKSPDQREPILQAEIASGDSSRSAAALEYAAKAGMDGILRQHMNSSDKDIARRANEAAFNNSSSLAGKAPDIAKGAEKAFGGAIKGKDLAGWSAGAAQAHVDYLNTLGTAERAAAEDQLKNAIKEIHRNPSLQAEFSGDTGMVYLRGGIKGTKIDASTGRIH